MRKRKRHILEGKKRSFAEGERGNVMGKETLVEGKKKISAVEELASLVEMQLT